MISDSFSSPHCPHCNNSPSYFQCSEDIEDSKKATEEVEKLQKSIEELENTNKIKDTKIEELEKYQITLSTRVRELEITNDYLEKEMEIDIHIQK